MKIGYEGVKQQARDVGQEYRIAVTQGAGLEVVELYVKTGNS